MTARQVFEYALIELNKVEAPSLLLEDFNYFVNKAAINYINKRYNVYDVNQQTSDDLRVLTGTAVLTSLTKKTGNALQGATYVTQLPQDYFHLLNCIAEYTPAAGVLGCSTDDTVFYGVKRLTADNYSQVIGNYYHKPSYKNPYYYIHNDSDVTVEVNQTGIDDEVKTAGSKDANSSLVNIEIRYGRDISKYVLTKVHVDYLKAPRHIKLTQGQIDLTEDQSQILEFPDYVCHEIIRELVMLLMENTSDPRLQTNIPVNQTIAPPLQMGGSAKR